MCIGFQAQNSVLSFLSCDLIVELIQRGLKLLLCMVMRSDPKGLTVASTHHVLSRLLLNSIYFSNYFSWMRGSLFHMHLERAECVYPMWLCKTMRPRGQPCLYWATGFSNSAIPNVWSWQTKQCFRTKKFSASETIINYFKWVLVEFN